MGWLLGGYFTAWFAVFGLLFAYFFPSSGNPVMLTFGCFVCLPLLVLGAAGGVHEVVPARVKADLDEGKRQGAFSAAFAFGVGVVTALVALVVIGALFFFDPVITGKSAGYLVALMPVVGGLAPLAGVFVLRNWCRVVEHS